jgi:hypothetical protein
MARTSAAMAAAPLCQYPTSLWLQRPTRTDEWNQPLLQQKGTTDVIRCRKLWFLQKLVASSLAGRFLIFLPTYPTKFGTPNVLNEVEGRSLGMLLIDAEHLLLLVKYTSEVTILTQDGHYPKMADLHHSPCEPSGWYR